jgi:hypothetical protein
MRSKRGESNFMTDHYALLRVTPSRLDRDRTMPTIDLHPTLS